MRIKQQHKILKALPSRQKHVTSKTIAPMSDAQLIQRIGSKKDARAFETLFKRHKNAMFNLAISITGSRSKAEDAVQEGMLNLWTYATSFQATGNAKGWIMKIVVRTAMKKKRCEINESKDLCEETVARNAIPCQVFKNAQQNELLNGMRTCIQKLPSTSQRMLTLYFTAEMSQTEIGHFLRIPQRTVSDHLKEALANLRNEMIAAGFGATLPIFHSAFISQALASGASHSGQFTKQVLNAVHQHATHAENIKTLNPTTPLAVSFGIVILTTLTAILVLNKPEPKNDNITSAITPTVKPIVQNTKSRTANLDHIHSKDQRHLRKTWNFEKGMADLEVILGNCSWNRAGKYLQAPLGMISPSIPLPDHAFVVRFKASPLKENVEFGSSVDWYDGFDRLPCVRTWRFTSVITRTKNNRNPCLEFKHYFVGHYCTTVTRGKIQVITEYQRNFQAHQLLIGLSNVKLRSLKIECLTLQEIPEPFRYPAKLLKTWPTKPDAIQSIPRLRSVKTQSINTLKE